MERTIDDIVEILKYYKKCSLLIGAGCSKSAGIPLGDEFPDIIKEKFPVAYQRAIEKTYLGCMAALNETQRRDLISGFIEKAGLNWAHIAMARLIQEGFVDRVLTVNFDPLVVKACALLGEFPAVYDFAATQDFKSAYIHGNAIFYLHGQSTGFRLMITPEDVKAHYDRLTPVFRDACDGRPWIVVGYSAENDPVFEHLAKVEKFSDSLFWIGHGDTPKKAVIDSILVPGKDAHFLPGLDADYFFVTLAQKLGVFPPDLVKKPFSHLMKLIEPITEYTIPERDQPFPFKTHCKKIIQQAIDEIESNLPPDLQANDRIMAADYEGVAKVHAVGDTIDLELLDSQAWALLLEGNRYSQAARSTLQLDQDNLYQSAYDKYQAALDIKPDFHEALGNWGNAIQAQAKMKEGEEAYSLFEASIKKYEAVLEIKPDDDHAFNNWGNALFYQAQMKEGEEADKLIEAACVNYKAALDIKPDKHEALSNWANALLGQAAMKEGYEAAKLLDMAEEKCLAADALSPGFGAYNLGCIRALRGDEIKCKDWLETGKKYGKLPSRKHLENDKDLDSVRDKEWFKEFLDSL